MVRNLGLPTVKSVLARPDGAGAAVVLGIDSRPPEEYRQAVLFATAEANRRRRALLLVHGSRPLMTATSLAPTVTPEQAVRMAEEYLSAAAELVGHHLSGDLPVELCVDPRTGAEALAELSGTASLIVLQRRAVSAVRRWHTGSTTSRLAKLARCPVVVVRDEHDGGARGSGVVVGVDDRGHAGTAVDVAFAEADLRRTQLIAVHAWRPSGPPADTGYIPPDPDERAAGREAARLELAEALAGHSATYPDVPVRREVVNGPVVDALLQAAAAAEILVIGRHGRSRIGTPALGSVARRCISEAPCPVMVTPVLRPGGPPVAWQSRGVPAGSGR